MKSRKRFQVRCVLILILSLLLTACESGKSSEKKEEDKKKENVSEAGEVSKEAQAVIETMMTAPNPDLLFTPSVIGEGVEEDEDAVRKNRCYLPPHRPDSRFRTQFPTLVLQHLLREKERQTVSLFPRQDQN